MYFDGLAISPASRTTVFSVSVPLVRLHDRHIDGDSISRFGKNIEDDFESGTELVAEAALPPEGHLGAERISGSCCRGDQSLQRDRFSAA